MKTKSLLNRVDTRLAACAAVAAGAAVAAPPAEATIVYSGPVNINIPVTTAGVYLNVVTGVNNPNPASVPGWDVNPYSSSTLSFFNPAAPAGGVYVTGLGSSTTLVDNLPLGTLINAGSVYGSGNGETTGATAFTLNSSNNFVGFRFTEATLNGGATAYGWFQISLGATLTAPRAIVGFAYEDGVGVGIQAGAIPEPSTFALLGVMAAGAFGVREWRKRKAA